MRSGITVTGQCARWMTSWATLPRSARTRPTPRLPMTISSASWISAARVIAEAAGPGEMSAFVLDGHETLAVALEIVQHSRGALGGVVLHLG